MTEKNGGVVTPKSGEQPPVAPAPVSGDGTQQPSQQPDEVGSLKEELELMRKELRGLQSKQDRSEDKFEKRLKELGIELTPEQRKEQKFLEMQERLAQLEGTQQTVTPASEATAANPRIAEVMAELEITDPTEDMKAVGIKYADNPIKMAAELVKLQSKKPPPSAANAVSPNTGIAPPPPGNLEKLTSELADIKAKNPHRSQWTKEVRERIEEITKEMDAALKQ